MSCMLMYIQVYSDSTRTTEVYSNAGTCKSDSEVTTISVYAQDHVEIIEIDLVPCAMCIIPRRDSSSKAA